MDRDRYVSLAHRASDLVDQGHYQEAIEVFQVLVESEVFRANLKTLAKLASK